MIFMSLWEVGVASFGLAVFIGVVYVCYDNELTEREERKARKEWRENHK